MQDDVEVPDDISTEEDDNFDRGWAASYLSTPNR